MFPETCKHVSIEVFHSIKVSTQIPTVKEVFKEVELNIIQRSSSEEDDNVALKVGTETKKSICHRGKHNPLSNNSEIEYFKLYPESVKLITNVGTTIALLEQEFPWKPVTLLVLCLTNPSWTVASPTILPRLIGNSSIPYSQTKIFFLLMETEWNWCWKECYA
ncbi:hypothetical protein O181_038938 [Austropuccinia psidii MF-1]|uniref:Uncharacterized protein n=1 Tax=Austropuccinia psidii MF-1 TaxID=1389203 RepID=A0A9Q3HBH1_9BASI|nr:hypothetical protein [Austropuccinia psidii MF-1]